MPKAMTRSKLPTVSSRRLARKRIVRLSADDDNWIVKTAKRTGVFIADIPRAALAYYRQQPEPRPTFAETPLDAKQPRELRFSPEEDAWLDTAAGHPKSEKPIDNLIRNAVRCYRQYREGKQGAKT